MRRRTDTGSADSWDMSAQKQKTNNTIDVLCVDPQIDDPSSSNDISRNSSTRQVSLSALSSLLLLLATSLHCIFIALML
ncbi:GDNF family receptor alpha-1a [Pimephales promelas]|nr:GDNF family receptor alpha-1a [Pimephales promelas]